MATIIVIGKDTSTRMSIRQALAEGKYNVIEADAPELLSDNLNNDPCRMAIVDVGPFVPDARGVALRVRAVPSLTPIPMLCLGRSDNAHAVAQVLDAGFDDYLRKPFVARELAARIRALLRRAPRQAPTTVIPLVLDKARHRVQVHGQPIDLTPTEFLLLDVLCQNSGIHLTAEDLLVRVWDYPPGSGDPALVRNHVRNLRRKIERDPNRPRIVTSAHGRGYMISVEAVKR